MSRYANLFDVIVYIAHILGILLMNSYEIKICSEATII